MSKKRSSQAPTRGKKKKSGFGNPTHGQNTVDGKPAKKR